jgi:hypothetical protein
VNIFDPHVFHFYFYVNTNPDLIANGILTKELAEQHWRDHGIMEGRQACGSFHTRQYLDRYPDLKKAFGKNYSKALDHYITTGISEGRLGYYEGGEYGRYTISQGVTEGIFLSGSDRMCGGIDSFVWNSNEFMNQWDHGRELQVAITTNDHGECYNPTECGNSDDLNGPTSSSVLLGIKASGQQLTTSNFPAFWLEPGEKEPNPNKNCQVALNKQIVSQYQLSKNVTIGVNGITNAVQFLFSVVVPENVSIIQIESPTGYMPADYSDFYTIDLQDGQLTAVDHGPAVESYPLVFSTPDGNYAMGAFIHSHPSTETSIVYGRWFFGDLGHPSDNTSKWTMVFRGGPYSQGTVLSFQSFICVGTLNDVSSCLVQLAQTTKLYSD